MRIQQSGQADRLEQGAAIIDASLGSATVVLTASETVRLSFGNEVPRPALTTPTLTLEGAGRVKDIYLFDGTLGLEVTGTDVSIDELIVRSGCEIELVGPIRVRGPLTIETTDSNGIAGLRLVGADEQRSALRIDSVRYESPASPVSRPTLELVLATCKLRMNVLDDMSLRAVVNRDAVLDVDHGRPNASIELEGAGCLSVRRLLESPLELRGSPTSSAHASLPRVNLRPDAEIRNVSGYGAFDCQLGSRVRGNPTAGFRPVTIRCDENVDLQYINMYETDVGCIKHMMCTRRVQPWWSEDDTFREALKNSRDAKPRTGKSASNALRWQMIRDIVHLRGTRGRDRVLASLLAFDARYRDAKARVTDLKARRKASGRRRRTRDRAELYSLWLARLFGYGCRVRQPLLVAAGANALLSLALLVPWGGRIAEFEHRGTPVAMWRVVVGLWFDLMVLPLSSVRSPLADGSWTNHAIHAVGLEARAIAMVALVLNTVAYLSALAAGIRYVRNRPRDP